MYKIYCDDLCIYDDTQMNESMTIIEPKLSVEDNSAGSFTARIPTGNIGYNSIKRLKSEIIIVKNNVEYWRGRIISESVDFWNNRMITCEGELSYLNDTIQIPKEFESSSIRSFLDYVLDKHNEHSDWNKKFYVGDITVEDSEYDVTFKTTYDTTLSVIFNNLISNFGGHIRIRKTNGLRYLDYLSEGYFRDCEQKIEFSSNLMDFTRNYDFSDFATVLIPLGAMMTVEQEEPTVPEIPDIGDIITDVITGGEVVEDTTSTDVQKLDTEYLTVASVNGGSIYVESTEAISNFGRIERKVEFSEVEDPTTLLLLAQLYLVDAQFDQMELEISAIDLSCIMDVDDVRLMDRIRVVSQPHGLDRYFPVRKLDICLDQPENSTFTLGAKTTNTLTNVTVKKTESVEKDVEQIKTEYTSRTEVRTSLDVADESIVAQVQRWTNGELEKYTTLEVTEDGLRTKVGRDEVVSEVNQSADGLDIKGNRLTVQSDNFTLDEDGTMSCKNANIEGNVNATSFRSELGMHGMPVIIQMQAGTFPLIIDSPTSFTRISPNSIDIGYAGGSGAQIGAMLDESFVIADAGYFKMINNIPVSEFIGGLRANSYWNKKMISDSSGNIPVLLFWVTMTKDTTLTFSGNMNMVFIPDDSSVTDAIVNIEYKISGDRVRYNVARIRSGENSIPLFAVIPDRQKGTELISITITGLSGGRVLVVPEGVQGTIYGYGLIDSVTDSKFNEFDQRYVQKDQNGNLIIVKDYTFDGRPMYIDTGYLEHVMIDTSDKDEVESVVIKNE